MITIGVDAHKRVHAAVAVDEAGRILGQWQAANSPDGWQALQRWATGWDGPRQWGIEGAWSYGRGLAQHLVALGEAVYEINPRWTAEGRKTARRRGKSDPLDARAVALLVWREGAALPRVAPEDETAILDLLVTERDNALAEVTRLRNQLHQLLLQLDPEYAQQVPSLRTAAGVAAALHYESTASDLQRERAAAVRRTAQRLRLAAQQVEQITEQIRTRAERSFSPLTRLCGVSLLTAGALAGILGPGHRFPSDAALAAYAGVAPLEASSAGRVRHRLNRGGNRRLNAILHRIALTQARHAAEARAYLDRRVAAGKSRREALRALKRFLVRAIWRLWQECRPTPAIVPVAAVA